MKRLAVVVTHPIQYFSPWFQNLARHLDLKVFYAVRQSGAGQAKAGFGVAFDWDIPLLEGYAHEFLDNVSRAPGVGHFRGCDTPGIQDRLAAFRADAVLVFGWNRKSYLQAMMAARRQGTPVFLRGDSILPMPMTGRDRVKHWCKQLPYRWLLRQARTCFYVGTRNRDYFRSYGVPDRRLQRLPHFVDNARIAMSPNLERPDGAHPAVELLFVGKLIEKKRPRDLLLALKRAVSLGGPSIRLTVAGDGPLRGELEGVAQSMDVAVRFLGFVNQSGMPAVYAAADVLVLPSGRGETWGLVVNEALAAGVVAVVSDAVGCAPDLVEATGAGAVYPCGDVEALAAAIAQVSRTVAADRESCALRARRAVADHTIDCATTAVLAALDALRSPQSAKVA